MLATVGPAMLDRVAFPLGGQASATTRDEAAAAGLAVAARAESQEACFLAGDDYRAFLERQGLVRSRSDRRRGRPRARPTRRRLALHPRAAPRDRGRDGGAPVRAPGGPATATLVVGRAIARVRDVRSRGRLTCRSCGPRRSSATGPTACPRGGSDGRRIHAPPRGARVRGRAGQMAALYDDGAIVGAGYRRRNRVGSPRWCSSHPPPETPPTGVSRCSSSRSGSPRRSCCSGSARRSSGSRRSSREPSATCCP